MNKAGLAPHTGKIIDGISKLDCIKPFVVVGGTALAIQLQTRKSEDLDFMRWKENKDDSLDVGWPAIEKQLCSIGEVKDVNVLGFDQVIFNVDVVKIPHNEIGKYPIYVTTGLK